MLSLNVNQLNVFLAAADTLNFTLAAQNLQVTQPSVSQHIQALEEHFGVPLFFRSGRSIELTEAGMMLVPLAREMTHLATRIEETMASLNGEVQGHIVVGCSTSTGRYFLPQLLALFHRLYPQVRATCHVASQDQSLQMLSEGRAHLALTNNPVTLPDLEYHQLIEEQIFLIVHPDHPWAFQGEIESKDLLDVDFVLPEEGSETYSLLREWLACQNISLHQLHTVIAMGSLEGIALSVQEGIGAAFVPEFVLNRLVKGKVKVVRIRQAELSRNIFVARNLRRPATAAQEAFWAFMTDPHNSVIQTVRNLEKSGIE